MKTLPTPARVYVGGVIGLGAALLARVLPRPDVQRPGTVWSLRPAAVPLVDHLDLQGEPAARAQRLDDVGVVRGRLRVAAAARPERDDARRGGERVQPVHVPHQGAQPAAPDALQHGLPGRSRCRPPAPPTTCSAACPGRSTWRRSPKPLVGAATTYFLVNTLTIATAIALSTQPAALQGLERELPVERAELLRRRRRGGARDVDGHRMVGALDHAARGGAALPDLPHLQGLSGPHRGRAAARARDGGPAPGDDRSAGARDRRQGSDVAVAHPARAALRRRGRARARHVATTTSRA